MYEPWVHAHKKDARMWGTEAIKTTRVLPITDLPISTPAAIDEQNEQFAESTQTLLLWYWIGQVAILHSLPVA